MHDERALAPPGPHEGEQFFDVLGGGQDMPVQRIDDVADAEKEMAVGQDRGRTLDRRGGVDQRHDMACPRRRDGVVQARERADVKGGHGGL